MKPVLSIVLLVLALRAVPSTTASITFSNSTTYQTLSGTPALFVTNNGTALAIGSQRVTLPPWALQHGALTTTNDLTHYIQISFDGANWTTVATNKPAATNDFTTDALTVPTQSLTVYTRCVDVATNSIKSGSVATFGTSGF